MKPNFLVAALSLLFAASAFGGSPYASFKGIYTAPEGTFAGAGMVESADGARRGYFPKMKLKVSSGGAVTGTASMDVYTDASPEVPTRKTLRFSGRITGKVVESGGQSGTLKAAKIRLKIRPGGSCIGQITWAKTGLLEAGEIVLTVRCQGMKGGVGVKMRR